MSDLNWYLDERTRETGERLPQDSGGPLSLGTLVFVCLATPASVGFS